MNGRIEMSSPIYAVLRNAALMAFLEGRKQGRKEMIVEVLSAMKAIIQVCGGFLFCLFICFKEWRGRRKTR